MVACGVLGHGLCGSRVHRPILIDPYANGCFVVNRQLVVILTVGKAIGQLKLFRDAGVLRTLEIANMHALIAGLKLPKLVVSDHRVRA